MRTANHLARGEKGPEVERLLFGEWRTSPLRLPREERYLFSVFFVIKPTVISQLQWREMKKREEEEGEKRKKQNKKKKREALCGT